MGVGRESRAASTATFVRRSYVFIDGAFAMTTATLNPPARADIQLAPSLALWLALLAFTAVCLALRDALPWLVTYPKDWVLPAATWINVAADAFVALFRPVFRAISAGLDMPMRAIQVVLQWLPWPVVMVAMAAISLRASGPKLAVFALITLVYVLGTGYWRHSMNTLALVLLAVPVSVTIGFALGVIAHRLPRARGGINACLDLMQTVPAFAYLIPLLLLFGFGPVVGLIASAIYAVPPMVRNTMLGLEMVPEPLKEAGLTSGCTKRQLFWLVEVPQALPQILVGINQTTMAAFSMVIVAAIIGGFEDVGWEVLSSMRKAQFGQSLLSGGVIALLAILIDRITLGFAQEHSPGRGWISLRGLAGGLAGCLLAALALRQFMPELSNPVPGSLWLPQLNAVNQVLLNFVRDHADTLEGIKDTAFYCLMLPLKVGIVGSATPAIWGFTLGPVLTAAYALLIAALTALATSRASWAAGVAVIVGGIILFFGFTGFPWPAMIALAGGLAWCAGGRPVAIFAVLSLLFILLTGLWPFLMQSAYLCALAVALCLLIGGGLGIWASQNDRVSAVLRPINDTLQTMPQFVFLIPALMFFKVGDFTALIAVMLYAIVPPIRYVEHGLRNVRADVVEAARQMGSTPSQLLWQVKLPMALPVIMLGLNQTINAGLSMLAIAAMVGTRDLGQQVYVALGKADTGLGLIAGLAIALVAMMSDRIIQAWSKQQAA